MTARIFIPESTNCPFYVPALKASFGRTISDVEINNEFEEIERVFTCISSVIDSATATTDNSFDIGVVTTSVIVDPAKGIIQYMAVNGDVEVTIKEPESGDPRLITLIIADGGSGKFNFPSGAAWTSDSNGVAMDGKPWDNGGLGGDYGALVTCINDGYGWVFIIYARHDIDLAMGADTDDIYNWR